MNITVTIQQLVQPIPLTDYLQEMLLIPRKVRHFLRTRKQVLLNGEIVSFHTLVKNGDLLQLTFLDSDYTLPNIQLGDAKKVMVLYEDEHLMVCDKPQGIKTHPNAPNEKDTLLNQVAAYLAPKNQSPYVVHRLDKETSGLILFAKDPVTLPLLGRMLENRTIHRTYQAIVSGTFSANSFTINKPIGKDRHDSRKRRIDLKNGQKAITHVKVIKTTKEHSFLEVQLDTGRTHQIRVHLASLTHPILGDPLYNPKKEAVALQLRAVALSFFHPYTQKEIQITSPKKLF